MPGARKRTSATPDRPSSFRSCRSNLRLLQALRAAHQASRQTPPGCARSAGWRGGCRRRRTRRARQGQEGLRRDVHDDLEWIRQHGPNEHLLALDAGFYGASRTGDVMSRATNDTQAVRMAIGPGIMYLVNTFAMTALALVFMLRYSVSLTLVPVIFAPSTVSQIGRHSRRHCRARCSRSPRRCPPPTCSPPPTTSSTGSHCPGTRWGSPRAVPWSRPCSRCGS